MTEQTKMHPFDETIQVIRKTALDNIVKHGHRLFSVKTRNLSELFLERLEVDNIKEYKCAACLQFLNEFGTVAIIDEFFDIVPLLWDDRDVPDEFKKVIASLKEEVESGRIVGPFYSAKEFWGVEGEGRFQHLNADMSFVDVVDRDQADHENSLVVRYYRFLYHVVTQLTREQINNLKDKIFEGSDLDKESKVEILNIFSTISEGAEAYTKHKHRDNYLWIKARELADGYFPIEGIDVSDLIEQAMTGEPSVALESFTSVQTRIEDYITEHVARLNENVDTYENLMAFLQERDYVDSVNRRYARIDEVPVIWTPQNQLSNDLFEFPEIKKIKWEDFRNEVLGSAVKISVAFTGKQLTNMVSITTDTIPSKPIFKWDSLENRNPLSWYILNGAAKLWGLRLDEIYPISGISLVPAAMNPLKAVDGLNGAIFFIEKARPYHKAELSLFDKFLIDDFKPYSTSLREYSKSKKLTNNPEASASGVLVGTNNYGVGEQVFIVETNRQIRRYSITK